MPYTEEDVIRLVTRYEGEAAMAANERDVRSLMEAQQALDESFRRVSNTQANYAQVQANYDRLTRANAEAVKDLVRDNLRVDESMAKAGVGTRNFGYALLNAGRSVQDFQAAGLMGILNNIEGLVTTLGGTAGLAGLLTAVAVGFQVLRPYVAEFFASLQGDDVVRFGNSIEGLQAKIKELTDKPHKLTIDYQNLEVAQQQLDLLKARLDAFDAAAKARTSIQEQQAKQVREAIVERGGGTDVESGAANIRNVVEQVRRQQGTFYRGQGAQVVQRAEMEEQLRQAEASLRFAELDPTADSTIARGIRDAIQQRLAALVESMDKAARKSIGGVEGGVIGGALRGEEAARAELERTVAANRPAFRAAGVGPEFEAALIAARRTAVESAKEQETLAAERKRDEKLEADRAKRQADEEKVARDKLTDELNSLGKAYEALDKEEIEQLRKEQEARTPEKQRAAQVKRAGERLKERQAEEKAGEARDKELEQALGGPAGQADVEQAGGAILQTESIRNPAQRARAQAQLEAQLRNFAYQRIVARQPGIEPERAAALAQQAPEFYRAQAERVLQVQAQQVQMVGQAAQQGLGVAAGNQAQFAATLRAIQQQVNLLHRVRRQMTPVGENFRDF